MADGKCTTCGDTSIYLHSDGSESCERCNGVVKSNADLEPLNSECPYCHSRFLVEDVWFYELGYEIRCPYCLLVLKCSSISESETTRKLSWKRANSMACWSRGKLIREVKRLHKLLYA